MEITHELLVGLAKSYGLFYLMGFFVIVTIYAFWPSLGKRFDRAANSILDDEDGPCR
ncbi:cbb3-type cytochrome c oxidase subunit 3 [Paracoccus fistulariae]|uniref:Cbb3-type cytochrome c oxidase subunit 3 n=1 Tax=Paracoccus fistulariae TaxID=658446 RepID=A0ABY7SI62_9RHOB|nr:cbb3-type cytochrome c oxidase subunit 3 [Paracoccus fistulariae]MDB6182080.1 cbb3-type cytochrome c oxidase subunit 3 [Paracoccus fistulariae]WCR06689.1 cbb3-type cytochrome c oxidase subunit 3 [Paracoccus fistulariae]